MFGVQVQASSRAPGTDAEDAYRPQTLRNESNTAERSRFFAIQANISPGKLGISGKKLQVVVHNRQKNLF